MIKNLEIENFKSIKNLKLNCKRINVFIGEPNTGKSNILEALGFLSHLNYDHFEDFVRFESMSNLFYDENLEDKIEIKFDENNFQVEFKNGNFIGVDNLRKGVFKYDYGARGSKSSLPELKPLKFYRFKVRRDFPSQESEFLLPPSADNLLAIILAHKGLRKLMKQIFDEYGLRVVLKPQENKIEVQKEVEDIIISYPYSLVSDTLQRIIFHLVAIETNKDSVIAFEEPESHAFPYYTKFLAERIALDKNNNQYFISTHNPYFLFPLIEKTPKNEIGIFVTYFEDYQTKVEALSEENLEKVMELDVDVFFNIEKFIKR